MSRPQMPGMKWNPKKKKAHFSIYVAGGKGKVRRERTVDARDANHAKDLWAEFKAEMSVSAPKSASFKTFIARELDRICERVKPSTATWYRDIVASRLLPRFDAMLMTAITKPVIEDFVSTCQADTERPITPARINGLLRVLRLLLHHAVDRGYITVYPMHKLQFLKVNLPELELRRAEQFDFLAVFGNEKAFMADLKERMPPGTVIHIKTRKIATTKRRVGVGLRPGSEAAKEYFARFASTREFFESAIETGLRREDLRLLQWENVDFAQRWVRVVSQKTGKAVAIPMTDACRAALLRLKARPLVSPFVFITDRGKPLSKSTIDDYFILAKRLAGLKRRCRFHDLRHTFGSNAANAGIPLQMISKAMGHASLKMTERYARPDDESVQRAFLGKRP